MAHGLTAAGAAVLMGNPDAALASALGAVVGEMSIETLDAMEQKPGKTMTPQERQALEKMKAQKELDQKTNTSVFKMAIQKRNFANLAAALFLTLTTPDHLVADAYHAAQRAMDFNHDISSLRAKDQEKQVEEEIEEPRLVFEDGYESDTSYNLRKAVLKREKSLAIKQAKGQSISLVEQYELDSLIDAYEERATRSAEVRAWKKTHQWVKEHPKRAAALGAGATLMAASGVMAGTGVGVLPAVSTSALGSAFLDYGLTDESVSTTQKAISMGKAATLGAVPFLKYPYMMMASGGIALYGYSADDSMLKRGGALTFAGGVLVKGVQTLVKGASVVPSASVSKSVEALGLDLPYTPPHNMTHGVSKNFSILQENIKGARLERLSRQEGLAKLKARPEGQVLELSHNVGNRQAFDRKITALQDLADRGKLVKTKSVRDPRVTEKYRDGLLDRAKQDWKTTDPDKFQRFKDIMDRMDADHLHELQLKGVDHSSMLSMLDKQVNRSVGSQIRHQLAKMPDGTPITKVIEKGSK